MLPALLAKPVRKYALFALGVPVAAWALRNLGEEIEERKGETRLTRALESTSGVLDRRSRGPIAERLRAGHDDRLGPPK